ncbi:MAG: biotin/lipoyl-containing protein [Acidobacteriota bacterium]
MKLNAEIAENKHEIEIKREGERVFANIDGREYDVEVSEPEPGVYLIKNAGKVYEVSISQDASAPGVMNASLENHTFPVRITDPKRLRGAADADGVLDGPAEIKTAMPGKVVRVLVAAGAEVEKGDGVVVVEAMKMQNELKAPKSGKIKEIRVSEGSTVAAGETLGTVE